MVPLYNDDAIQPNESTDQFLSKISWIQTVYDHFPILDNSCGAMALSDLKQKILNISQQLFAGTPVEFAYLYGSVAKDLKNPFSDLDIAIFVEGLDTKKSLKLELSLSLALDDLLDHVIESDVRIINHLPMTVQGDIITTGILIYCQDDAKRVHFETNLRMAFFDFLPVIRRYKFERICAKPSEEVTNGIL